MPTNLVEDRTVDIGLQILDAIDQDLALREQIEIEDTKVDRGTNVGPLAGLLPIFFDLESTITADITLKTMTLRQYSSMAEIETCAITVGPEEVLTYFNPSLPGLPEDVKRITPELIKVLQGLAEDPGYVWVAFNAAFDTRMLRFKYRVPHPKNVWCAMEGAMAAWPELPGGYSLDNCSCRLGIPKAKRKFPIDLAELTKLRNKALQGPVRWKDIRDDVKTSIESIAKRGKLPIPEIFDIGFFYKVLEIYNSQDVEALREIYYRQIPRVAPVEQEVALRTHHQRRHHFEIDPGRLEALIKALDQEAAYAAKEAKEYLSEEQVKQIFNRNDQDGKLSSVRYLRLKNVINQLKQDEDEDFTSASLKKISPVKLAKNPTVGKLLENTTKVGKMLSHRRRSAVFYGVNEVDVELGFARAHTMRFSSPSVGRGLNLHNCVSAYSLILTKRGWVPILQLNEDDLLWDGQTFISFAQITPEGQRSTTKVGAAALTSEQPVLIQGQWKDAGSLSLSQQVQCVADGLSWSLQGTLAAGSESAVLDAEKRLSEYLRTSINLSGAEGAPIADLPELAWRAWTKMLWPSNGAVGTTSSTEVGTETISGVPSSLEKKTRKGLGSALPGETTPRNTSNISSPFLDGMISLLSSIASITTEGMNPETSGSLLQRITAATEALLSGRRMERSSQIIATGSAFRTCEDITFSDRVVFDIRGAGPRERFICDGVITKNCPKHMKEVAKPVRQTFHLPEHLCFVRGDLSNVEYRLEGLITDCKTVRDMFDPEITGDPKSIFTDPYCQAWAAMTGMKIAKDSPVRQVSKQAVLGLGFCMSAIGYAKVLLKAIADKFIASEDVLKKIIEDSGWGTPPQKALDRIRGALGCSNVIATSAHWIHHYFNKSHPEFRMTAEWLVATVEVIAAVPKGGADEGTQHAFDIARAKLDWMYKSSKAPRRDMIDLQVENDPLSRYFNIRVACGPWAPTVCWREPQVRNTSFGGGDAGQRQLTVLKATGLAKPFTPQLAIENVTQAAARNAMCMGVARLDRLGFRDCIHIHDEVLLIVPRQREAVLAARDALLKTFGPKHDLPYKWAILIKPNEVTLTQSLWEDEDDVLPPHINKKGKLVGNDRWRKVEENTPDCWDNLP